MKTFLPLPLIVTLLLSSRLLGVSFPAYDGAVSDGANILPYEVKAHIARQVDLINGGNTAKVAVVTVPTLQGISVEAYANSLFNTWGIGDAGYNNGVLVLVSPSDRRCRIEVGDGLNHILPDYAAQEIIQRAMIPHFRNNDYPGGLRAGVDELVMRLGTTVAYPQPPPPRVHQPLEAVGPVYGTGPTTPADGLIVLIVLGGIVVVGAVTGLVIWLIKRETPEQAAERRQREAAAEAARLERMRQAEAERVEQARQALPLLVANIPGYLTSAEGAIVDTNEADRLRVIRLRYDEAKASYEQDSLAAHGHMTDAIVLNHFAVFSRLRSGLVTGTSWRTPPPAPPVQPRRPSPPPPAPRYSSRPTYSQPRPRPRSNRGGGSSSGGGASGSW